MIAIFIARIEDHVLMMLLPRHLRFLFRIRKIRAFYFFRAAPVHVYLRPSNEGLLRPRVARAQKIIRLHPLLCSASRRTTRRPPIPLLALGTIVPAGFGAGFEPGVP